MGSKGPCRKTLALDLRVLTIAAAVNSYYCDNNVWLMVTRLNVLALLKAFSSYSSRRRDTGMLAGYRTAMIVVITISYFGFLLAGARPSPVFLDLFRVGHHAPRPISMLRLIVNETVFLILAFMYDQAFRNKIKITDVGIRTGGGGAGSNGMAAGDAVVVGSGSGPGASAGVAGAGPMEGIPPAPPAALAL